MDRPFVIILAVDRTGLYTQRKPAIKTRPFIALAVLVTSLIASAWRGVMLDECRHFFGKEAVKKTLDAMADHKMNVFHWHLTEDQAWRLAVPKFPKLITYGCAAQEVSRRRFHGDSVRYFVNLLRHGRVPPG